MHDLGVGRYLVIRSDRRQSKLTEGRSELIIRECHDQIVTLRHNRPRAGTRRTAGTQPQHKVVSCRLVCPNLAQNVPPISGFLCSRHLFGLPMVRLPLVLFAVWEQTGRFHRRRRRRQCICYPARSPELPDRIRNLGAPFRGRSRGVRLPLVPRGSAQIPPSDRCTSPGSGAHSHRRSPHRRAPADRPGCIAPSLDRSRASSSDASRTRPGTTGRGVRRARKTVQ